MVNELPDARTLLENTDWSHLEHGFGSADPETPFKLSGLMSGGPAKVAAALNHLWDDLLHQGSLYTATPAAALYISAILGDSKIREPLSVSDRIKLLEWIAESAYAVGAAKEQQLEAWFGPGVMGRNPLFVEMRSIRPLIFQGVFPCIFDSNEGVVEAALLAAAHLMDAPELSPHIEFMAPKMRSVLAVSSKRGYRDVAILRLSSWGENVESLKDSMGVERDDDDCLDDFWDSPRGPLDEPPF